MQRGEPFIFSCLLAALAWGVMEGARKSFSCVCMEFASGLSHETLACWQPAQAGGLQVANTKATLLRKAGEEGLNREALQVSEQGRISAGSTLVLLQEQ